VKELERATTNSKGLQGTLHYGRATKEGVEAGSGCAVAAFNNQRGWNIFQGSFARYSVTISGILGRVVTRKDDTRRYALDQIVIQGLILFLECAPAPFR
jgi:hypothetical protein